MAFGWHGTQRQSHTCPEPTPPLGSLAQEPISLPLPCALHPEPRQLWPCGSGDPSTMQTGGHSSPPNCGDHVPVTVLLTVTQTVGGETGEGEGEGPGGCSCPGLTSPPLGTRSPTSVLFLARRGSSAGGGLREEPEVSELAGETTQEQPRWGGGPWVESWVGSPRDPPHRPGLQAQGDGKMAFLLPSYQRPPDQTGVSGALAMEMGVQDGTESSFWGRLGGRAPGAPLLGCWFGFALKPRLLR